MSFAFPRYFFRETMSYEIMKQRDTLKTNEKNVWLPVKVWGRHTNGDSTVFVSVTKFRSVALPWFYCTFGRYKISLRSVAMKSPISLISSPWFSLFRLFKRLYLRYKIVLFPESWHKARWTITAVSAEFTRKLVDGIFCDFTSNIQICHFDGKSHI